jgi:hypothetical protein
VKLFGRLPPSNRFNCVSDPIETGAGSGGTLITIVNGCPFVVEVLITGKAHSHSPTRTETRTLNFFILTSITNAQFGKTARSR